MPICRLLEITIAAASLACAAGCAAALNYDDPAGPVLVVQQPSSRLATGGTQARDLQREVGRARGSGGRTADTAGSTERRRRAVSPGNGRARHGEAGARPRHELHLRPLGTASIVATRLRRRRSLALAAGRWAQVPLPHEHRFRKLRRAAVAATVRTPAGNLRAYSVHFETVYGLWSEGHRRHQARGAVLADTPRHGRVRS